MKYEREINSKEINEIMLQNALAWFNLGANYSLYIKRSRRGRIASEFRPQEQSRVGELEVNLNWISIAQLKEDREARDKNGTPATTLYDIMKTAFTQFDD